ncbi:response regulator transcription factor [Pedobacter fastidiosus]|uniref:Helix-turn-helix transcriptional regulator n=1 Tax=Pedobacter fastidiosus TaxID=2765361 RepID=A0ABR7KSP7_9SPHI|nr:helix-turn-helix transcriptional regulator [Pedobacter fastidiosus]MBC6111131.1 helix-turn-helix transcriptional regulator [Pedobacter fastidiosus]
MVSSYTNNITEEMHQMIIDHQASFNLISGVVILHDIRDWSIAFMSQRGLNELKIVEEELYLMTNEEYHARFFNADDASDYVPKIAALIQKNSDDATVSFYQQLKFPDSPQWRWHLSSIRIFMRDQDGVPIMSITISIPVDAMHHMAAKADRLLEENNFLRNNYTIFSKLSKREKTILKEMALGKSSIEIANELCISPTTVDTHRRNIREKLNTKSSFEISKYARAFDLI